jgi:glyceraldehyde-3-phosphate dehydrogenase/erythrose-4-phosphate dehydrogenase
VLEKCLKFYKHRKESFKLTVIRLNKLQYNKFLIDLLKMDSNHNIWVDKIKVTNFDKFIFLHLLLYLCFRF